MCVIQWYQGHRQEDKINGKSRKEAEFKRDNCGTLLKGSENSSSEPEYWQSHGLRSKEISTSERSVCLNIKYTAENGTGETGEKF